MLHSSVGVGTIWLYTHHPSIPLIIKSAATGLIVIATSDLLRFQFPWFERVYEGLLGYFMRESERGKQLSTTLQCVCGFMLIQFGFCRSDQRNYILLGRSFGRVDLLPAR